jgi:tetratricopeptide (TPR) repeat protein
MRRVQLPVGALLLAACAQTTVVPQVAPASPPPVAAAEPATPPPPLPQGKTITNTELGFTLELPVETTLAPQRDRGLIAKAPDGTKLNVFFENLVATATEDGCWKQLFDRLSGDMPEPPKAIEALRLGARQGLDQGRGRLFLAVYPRGNSCLVLAIDGPKKSEVLAQAAPLAMATFKPTTPSPEFTAKLAFEAGVQLLDRKEYAAALAQFDIALKGDETLQTRAHYGAGLAAYFLGPASAALTVDHLSKVVAARSDPERDPEDGIRTEQYRDALMYLGLAYASLKQFPHATSTLAELVERFPDDAIGRYNFACVLALGGEQDEALDELRTALKGDPELTDHAKKDDDLKSLRGLPAWKALTGDTTPAR